MNRYLNRNIICPVCKKKHAREDMRSAYDCHGIKYICFECCYKTVFCGVCGRNFAREDMRFTHDCHGIPYRLVCFQCYDKVMEKGYDGEYYTESDECLDYDY